jgi:acyl-CoA synthetase (AMP-forming)/AMP-acid ligase II
MTIFNSKFSPLSVPTNCSVTDFVFNGPNISLNKAALIDGHTGFTFTFAQLRGLIDRVSKNLYHDYSLRKGQVVALMLPNTPWYAVLLNGIVSTGAICTTVNPIYTREELHHQLSDSGARLIITIPMFFDNLVSALDSETKIEGIIVLSQEATIPTTNKVKVYHAAQTLFKEPKDNKPLNIQIDPRKDLAFLPYSSGTTGLSKGVKLTHHNVMYNMAQIESVIHFNPEEVVLGLLPMFHIYGLVVVLNSVLRSGATVVTMAKFDFVPFLEIVQKYKVTYGPLVPPILLALAKHPIVAKYDISSLKHIVSGAAPLAPSLASEVANKFGINVKNGYGMTEASPVLATPEDGDKDYASVGILLPMTDLKVVDVATGKELGEGEEGELCFRGPQVMQGYLNNDQATRDTIKNGWLHSGDIGYYKNQHVYITDRLKELIKVKGFQVPPAELEALLVKNPNIADAGVIGIPDERNGEIPKAFVVKRQGVTLTEKDVIDYMSEHVAPHKRVRVVEFVNEIPKTAAGKILRRVLKEREKAKLLPSKL